MNKSLEKNSFLIAFPRFYTREGIDAHALIDWTVKNEAETPHQNPVFAPSSWSEASSELFMDEAAYKKAPLERQLIEENTVPSWLWRKKAKGKKVCGERNAALIIDRVVGAATFHGWKLGIFVDEKSARNFYDEARFALAQRFIAFEPGRLASLGLDWAYGHEVPFTTPQALSTVTQSIDVSNADIDAIVGGTTAEAIREKWQKLSLNKKSGFLKANFRDVINDWQTTPDAHGLAAIDLMAFQDHDGSIKVEALKHSTRILIMLLDLFDGALGPGSIGFVNLASLLMAQGLAYDSHEARATAAALAAIITGEAFAVSSELASLRGQSQTFKSNREKILRVLRNHRRAVVGDKNDYEKISVLPQPLLLQDCPDLGLIASAERIWDHTLMLVQKHGLRHHAITTLTASNAMTLFLECPTKGLEPLKKLVITSQDETGHYTNVLLPSVIAGLKKFGYNDQDRHAFLSYVLGHLSLDKAPKINRQSLHARGFDGETLKKIEDYLPLVTDIRMAMTPWVVGETFCQETLKVSSDNLENPSFNLLAHLGFDDEAVVAFNTYCYGHNHAEGNTILTSRHNQVFASGSEIKVDARLSMAAAVQSFVSGDVGFTLEIPSTMNAEKQHKIILDAWRAGLKNVTLVASDFSQYNFDEMHEDKSAVVEEQKEEKTSLHRQKTKRTMARVRIMHARDHVLPTRKSKPKAGSRLLTLSKNKGTTPHDNKDR